MILTTWSRSRPKNVGSGSSKILRLHRLCNTNYDIFLIIGAIIDYTVLLPRTDLLNHWHRGKVNTGIVKK
jgi:hypothetical protein